MTFAVVANLFSVLLDLLGVFARTSREKDLEILLLRKPLRILQRKRTRPPSLVVGESAIGTAFEKIGSRDDELPCSAQPQSAPVSPRDDITVAS